MATTRATVATEHASRYLQQLCKHWSHRFTVDFDALRGTIALDGATCRLEAEPAELRIAVEAPEAERLPRLESVVEEHIKRFAFREELAFEWLRAAT